MPRSPGGLHRQIDDEADHQVLARGRALGDEQGKRRQRPGVEPVLHALLLRVRQGADALVAVGEGMVLTTRWSRFAALSSRERSRGSPNMVCPTLPGIDSKASPRGLPNRDDASLRAINSRWNAALVMAALIGDAPFPAPFLLPDAPPCLSPLAFDDRPDPESNQIGPWKARSRRAAIPHSVPWPMHLAIRVVSKRAFRERLADLPTFRIGNSTQQAFHEASFQAGRRKIL